jgi:hypothetical protein
MNHRDHRCSAGVAGLSSVLAAAALVLATPFPVAEAQPSAEVLFEQPTLDGVEGNVIVPTAEHRPPSNGVFHIVLWQPNPNRPDGQLVPTDWRAGDRTGFYPSAPVQKHQSGFSGAAGTTTLQIDGDTVGAYIRSADLPEGSHKYKMMMTPELSVAPAAQVHPFAQGGRAILVSLDLQVPTAADAHNNGSETYVDADLMFVDRSRGTKISYGCSLFFNGHPHRPPGGHIRLDQDSQNMMVNSVVDFQNPWLTVERGSAVAEGAPWSGWRTFRFAITEQNFIEALNAYRKQDGGANVSVNPADYSYVKFHLNAELHFQTAPAELGWSMRHAKVVVEDAAQVAR